MAGYVAAKHGVIGLTKAAAIEYASLGIRVNALAPGWVETPMTVAVKSNSALIAVMRKAAPIARPAQPGEMAGPVLLRSPRHNANELDRLQVIVCVLATLCIASLFAVDIYMGLG